MKIWKLKEQFCKFLNVIPISLSMISRCDAWQMKGKYRPSNATTFLPILLIATCFGFGGKPSSGKYK